jgi:hypothetical protein
MIKQFDTYSLLNRNTFGIEAKAARFVEFYSTDALRAFLGTGLNLSNSVAVTEAFKIPCVSYVAISKELTKKEGQPLVGSRVFTLACGNLKVMDLCYCPFEKTCKDCDKKDVYTLTDENGRVFAVRRFVRADGSCRFEVFNCADLVGSGTAVAGRLIDATIIGDPSAWERALDDEEKQKRLTEHYTQGHHYKSVN